MWHVKIIEFTSLLRNELGRLATDSLADILTLEVTYPWIRTTRNKEREGKKSSVTLENVKSSKAERA